MAGGWAPVLRPLGAAGSGFAGFRCAGQIGQRLADVPEPPPDPGRGEAARRAGPLPGQPQVGGEVTGKIELGVAGDGQPGPPVGGGRVAEPGPGPPRICLKNLNMCSISKRRRNACQARFTSAAEVPARDDHSHSGSGLRSPGRRSTCSRMRVPSMTGSSPSWFSHPARLASRWCSRPQAMAAAEPYRVVWVRAVTAGAGQGCFPASRNAAPCRTGRPFVPGSRAGAGKYMTRSLRSRPSTSTGRSRSSQASRVRS